jgi:SAM-dependent methyltransferase
VRRWASERPRPVPAGFYSAELLKTFAAGEHEAFVAAGGRPLRPRLARSLALADIRPGLSVADIGCGRGEAAAHAARRGARVVAVDYSLQGLVVTRDTVSAVTCRDAERRNVEQGDGEGRNVDRGDVEHGCFERPDVELGDGEGTDATRGARGGGWAHVVAADASALPLAPRSVDRVLLLDVIEHLYDWQLTLVLAEVRRILAPGGYVVMHTLPNRWALAVAYPILRLWSGRLPPEARSSYERAVHVNEQDPWRLRRSLHKAGFASRVWVEEWTTRHAACARGRLFPDPARSAGYPVLRSPGVRRMARLAMRTPARNLVGNDIFALAWRPIDAGPPVDRRFQPVR